VVGEPVSAADLLEELRRRRLVSPASQMLTRVERVTSGLASLDAVCGGGFPRGRIVEVLLPVSGAGTILYSFLAAATGRGEVAAVVDPADGFEVASALEAGVALERLLWVRARSKKEALRAAELILEAGGFGAVVLDDMTRERKRPAVPSSAWMRLKKLAAASGAVLLVLSRSAQAGTFSSLSVRVQRGRARFSGKGERWLEGIDLSFELLRMKQR
jgi:hypothetical protein